MDTAKQILKWTYLGYGWAYFDVLGNKKKCFKVIRWRLASDKWQKRKIWHNFQMALSMVSPQFKSKTLWEKVQNFVS